MVKAGESLVGGCEFCSHALELGKGFSASFGIESLDRVFDDSHFVTALEQAFGCKADAVFRHDSKNEKLRAGMEVLKKLFNVTRLENIESLFFQHNLLLVADRLWKVRGRRVGDTMVFICQSFGDKLRA